MKTKQQIIDDGRSAERLLEDTDLSRFLEEIERECWGDFKLSDPDDSSGREATYMKLRGIELVRQSLRAMKDNASIAMKAK